MPTRLPCFDDLPPLPWSRRVLRRSLLLGQRIKRPSADVAEDLWSRALGTITDPIRPTRVELARTLCELRVLPSPGGQAAVDQLLHRVLTHLSALQQRYTEGQAPIGGEGRSWLGLYRQTHAVIQHLLALGANPVARATPTAPCLFEWAMRHDHADLIHDMLVRGVNPNQATPQGQPWLLLGLVQLRHALKKDARAIGRPPPKNFKSLGVMLEHPNVTVFKEGARHHQLGCWESVRQCVAAGANPWVVAPDGRDVLSHAMDESEHRVGEVLKLLHQWSEAHPRAILAMQAEPRPPLPLAAWLSRSHHEFFVANPQANHFEILPVLRRLSQSNGGWVSAAAFQAPDAAGRNFLQAWLASGRLGLTEWLSFKPADTESAEGWDLWAHCDRRDDAGNTALHAVFSRRTAWDPDVTRPDVIEDIVATLLERMRAEAQKKGAPFAGFASCNQAGETPHVMMLRTMEEENWPPVPRQAAANGLAHHLAAHRQEQATRTETLESATLPARRSRPRA